MLRRRKNASRRDDTPRTRISMSQWARTHRVETPERDLSEWVRNKMTQDWEAVKKGNNRG